MYSRNRDIILRKVMSKLADSTSDHIKKVKDMAKKYKELTPENAIEYAKIWEDYHNYKVIPKTRETKEDGQKIIEVKLEGNDWYSVWFDSYLGGLYGEY